MAERLPHREPPTYITYQVLLRLQTSKDTAKSSDVLCAPSINHLVSDWHSTVREMRSDVRLLCVRAAHSLLRLVNDGWKNFCDRQFFLRVSCQLFFIWRYISEIRSDIAQWPPKVDEILIAKIDVRGD